MSVLATAPPAPAPPAPGPRPAQTAKRSRRLGIVLGLVLVVIILVVAFVIFASFAGTFSSYAVVEAQLPASATAVSLNAPVEYRNVTVGEVASDGRSVPGGLVVLTLHMKQSMLNDIPAAVTATETPVSFFGDTYLELIPPPHIGTATLRAGATIPALRTGATASLQATLGDLDGLLLGLHPAELDEALTALAGAVQGEGTSLGHNLVRGNAYFSQMLKLWPTVVADMKALVPVTGQFSASEGNIIRILSNQTTTASTINADASSVRQAISGGAELSTKVAQLFHAIEQPYDILTADSGPFLKDISQNPTEISQLLSGLDEWATAWTAAESSGPYLTLSADTVVANPADLGLAVLGGPDMAAYLSGGLGPGYVNPPTYTSPGSIHGMRASAEQAATALAKLLATAPEAVMPAGSQTHAVSEIVKAMSGSSPASPAVSSLLLSPLLASLVNG